MEDITSDSSRHQWKILLAFRRISQILQKCLDDTILFQKTRWIAAAAMVVLFLLRIIMLQGWYLVVYTLGMYHSSLLFEFLSPKVEPTLAEFEAHSCPSLPSLQQEEFRPFIRRLPEFNLWYSVVISTMVSIVLTFFNCFNIPVYLPILVLYFMAQFYFRMGYQIKNMIYYRYLPFTHGKPKYHESNPVVSIV